MRILCLGNNTEDTDTKTRELARQNSQQCHGLLSELGQILVPEQYQQDGYYHSSVYDLRPGRLRELIAEFDQVVMLDQPKSQWTHPYAYNNTIEMIKSAGQRGCFQNPEFTKINQELVELLENNKSFCLFPFVQLSTFADGTSVCCHSGEIITKIDQLKNWKTDPGYEQIRQNMLNGVRVPKHCDHCYRQEDAGLLSPRWVETTEWAQRLNIQSVDELLELEAPLYYDIRPSNRCNLMCRMCNPDDSHLIAKEYKQIGIAWHNQYLDDAPKHYIGFDVVDLDRVQKLLVAGGEPSIMVEFYEFLERCIQLGRTDFEITITTNANRFSKKFKQLLQHFSNVNFIVSLDGYQDLNHYIRYPSDWNSIVGNLQYLIDQQYPVSIHTTITILNISSLHELFEYLDQQFPDVLVDWDVVDHPRMMSHRWFPAAAEAIDCLNRVKQTNCYKNSALLFQERIDSCLDYFLHQHQVDQAQLKEFFVHNDKLDLARSIRLIDHVPVLDKYRNVVV